MGKTFLKTTCTRWCSEYNAVEYVIDIGLVKVIKCQKALGLSQITQTNLKFLTAFIIVMKPIVQAMKSLEGENDCCLGHVMGVERKILERKILERKLQSFHD